MVDTLPTQQERQFTRAYVYRKVMNWKYEDIAKYFYMTSREAQSNAEKAALLYDLKHSREGRVGIVVEACEDLVTREGLKEHRNHVQEVAQRLDKKIKNEA